MKEIKDTLGNVVMYTERRTQEIRLVNGNKVVIRDMSNTADASNFLGKACIQDDTVYHMVMRHFLTYSKIEKDIDNKCKDSLLNILVTLGRMGVIDTTEFKNPIPEACNTSVDCDELLEKILKVVDDLVDRVSLEYDIDTLVMAHMYDLRKEAIEKNDTLSIEILSKHLIDAEFDTQRRYEKTCRKIKILTLAKTKILEFENKLNTMEPRSTSYDFTNNDIAITAMMEYSEDFTNDEKIIMHKLDLSEHKG